MGLAFLITSENLQLLGERKVLKQAEYTALLDAAQVLEAARQEGQRLLAQAAREAEDRRRQGYEDGVRAARAEVAQTLVSQAEATQLQLAQLRSSMAQIVVKAVGQFMADADPALLYQAALLRVEALIRAEAFVSVRVAPAQEAALRRALDRLKLQQNWALAVSVQADASLPEGACTVHTASGTVDIGLDAQLDVFRRAVQRQGERAGEGARA
ncbi:MAG: type III secretion system stator protein SctL [Pseudomonadota bacterium]